MSVNLKLVEAAADPLAALVAERTELAGKIDEYSSAQTRLKALEDEESTVLDEIGAIGARETEAVRKWAANGCKGDCPGPLTKEREAAAKRLADAQAKAASGARAASEVGRLQLDASKRIAEINAEIDRLVLDDMEAEWADAKADYRKALAEAQRRAAQVYGARNALLHRAEWLRGNGRDDEAAAIFRKVEQLDADRLDADATPTNGQVNAAADAIYAAAERKRSGE